MELGEGLFPRGLRDGEEVIVHVKKAGRRWLQEKQRADPNPSSEVDRGEGVEVRVVGATPALECKEERRVEGRLWAEGNAHGWLLFLFCFVFFMSLDQVG